MKTMKKRVVAIAVALTMVTAAAIGVYFIGFNNNFYDLSDDAVPLAQNSDAQSVLNTMVLTPVASGTNVNRNARGEIDYSNTADGYVMARWRGAAGGDVRVVIVGPGNVQYQYRLNTEGEWEVFPLSVGNGEYVIRIMQRTPEGRFAVTNTVRTEVTLTDEFAPFLRPNQFVHFTYDTKAVVRAAHLVEDSESTLESVGLIFNWVITNITYDRVLAQTVQSGYVPDLDLVYERRQGICFDYAALMAAMLRSQGIPTRLVIGYVGTVYHAWISVFTEEYGWVNNIIMFDGNEWRIMDPTFAASENQADALRFIGTGANHREVRRH